MVVDGICLVIGFECFWIWTVLIVVEDDVWCIDEELIKQKLKFDIFTQDKRKF